MSCALCKLDKHLCDSHIIPEFVYRQLYDKKHRFHVLSTQKRRPRPLQQKGLKERLLCSDCEQRFSAHERYARGILLGGAPFDAKHRGNYIELGLEYKPFKLFQMSVLWRASVATHALFSRVRLGPHEEHLRVMLLSDDPGRPTDYPCIVMGLKAEKGLAHFIDQPTTLRIDGYLVYRFIFAGFIWVYFVSSHGAPPVIREIALNEKGQMKVWIGKFEELGYLKEFAADVHRMGRTPQNTDAV